MLVEYISVKQMAGKLNVSLDTAYEYTHMKGFPACKIGRTVRIPVDRLEEWLKKKIIN